MSSGTRITWEERQARRRELERQKVDAYRHRIGIRTIPPESKLPFLCGRADCGRAFGHSGEHGAGA